MSHYELTEEAKEIFGCTLHRIRAKEDFTNAQFGKVKAGTPGGFVEGEKCISDDALVGEDACISDDAMVSHQALVYGDARVSEHTTVRDKARVSGMARVSGNALVSERAWITGNAQISYDACVSGNAFVSGNAHIGRNGDIRVTTDYLTIGPIGSRNDYTTFYKTKGHGIWVFCGCFNGSIDDFRKEVIETHGENQHAVDYQAATDFAEKKLMHEVKKDGK